MRTKLTAEKAGEIQTSRGELRKIEKLHKVLKSRECEAQKKNAYKRLLLCNLVVGIEVIAFRLFKRKNSQHISSCSQLRENKQTSARVLR